jgi:hypothetical protein
MQTTYASVLATAKTCNPVVTVQQCTAKVDDELACPCSTFINPSNTAAAAELAKLQISWKAKSCQLGIVCPAALCPQPSGAACVGAGGGTKGSCHDITNN